MPQSISDSVLPHHHLTTSSSLPRLAPHKGTGLDHALDVGPRPARVRRAEVPHKVVAAVVDVARLGLCAPRDAAPEGQTLRVRDALVALQLLARRKGDGAEVAWQLLVLANLLVPESLLVRLLLMSDDRGLWGNPLSMDYAKREKKRGIRLLFHLVLRSRI